MTSVVQYNVHLLIAGGVSDCWFNKMISESRRLFLTKYQDYFQSTSPADEHAQP